MKASSQWESQGPVAAAENKNHAEAINHASVIATAFQILLPVHVMVLLLASCMTHAGRENPMHVQ